MILIITVLLFAVATALLYMIGLKKKMTENERLREMLMNNAALRVVKYLREHQTVTEDGIGHLIKEVKAKEFYSKKTAVIVDGKDFQEELIDYMLRNNHIQESNIQGSNIQGSSAKGKRVYTLAKNPRGE
ncbi:MAG: hypothetical protein IKE52_06885 [Mogibacterium sp.]|nr:hypothetical protein [Mogibacterium sp.]